MYKGLVTTLGQAKLNAAALGDGPKVQMVALVVGRGTGDPFGEYEVAANQTALANEVDAVQLLGVSYSTDGTGKVLVTARIDPTRGTYWITEAGIRDVDGDLIVVLSLPPIHKIKDSEFPFSMDSLFTVEFTTTNPSESLVQFSAAGLYPTWEQVRALFRDFAVRVQRNLITDPVILAANTDSASRILTTPVDPDRSEVAITAAYRILGASGVGLAAGIGCQLSADGTTVEFRKEGLDNEDIRIWYQVKTSGAEVTVPPPPPLINDPYVDLTTPPHNFAGIIWDKAMAGTVTGSPISLAVGVTPAVVIGDHNGDVIALNVADATELWRFVSGTGTIWSRCATDGTQVFAATFGNGGPGRVVTTDNAGAFVWHVENAFGNATGMATSGGANTIANAAADWAPDQWAFPVKRATVTITAGAGMGQSRAITANTGTTLTVSPNWDVVPNNTSQYRIDAPDEEAQAMIAAPVVHGGTLWVADGGGLVREIDLANGATLRKWGVPGHVEVAPLLADINGDGQDELVLVTTEGWAYAVSTLTWTEVWRTELGAAATEPQWIGGHVVLGCRDNVIRFLHGEDGTIAYTSLDVGSDIEAPPVAIEDDIAFATAGGTISRFTMAGLNVWTRPASHQAMTAQPSVVDVDGDGTAELLTPDAGGTLLVLRPNGSPLGSFFAPGPVHERLLVGDVDGDGQTEMIASSGATIRMWRLSVGG